MLNLGNTYTRIKDTKKAAEYFEAVRSRYLNPLKIYQSAGRAYGNLANVTSGKKKYEYAQKGLALPNPGR